MFVLSLLLSSTIFVSAADYQLNFENLPGYAVPKSWELDGWGYAEGYRSKVSDEGAHEGRYCFALTYEGEQLPEGYGRTFQKMDVADFRGKRVAFRAAVRVTDAGTTARLMLQGKTQSKREVLIAGTIGEPIKDTSWRVYEMVGFIGNEIQELEMSLIHKGRGTVLVDDIELVVLGDLPGFKPLPPTELDERAVKNFIVLGRVLGLLQYFHPSDQAAVADWNALARGGVLAVENAHDSNELCALLETHFASVAPTLRLFAKGKRPHSKSVFLDKPKEAKGTSAVRWTHTGFAREASSERFSSEREREPFEGKMPRGWLKPEKAMDFDVGAFVVARLATTLYADEAGTIPHTAEIEAMGATPIEVEAGWSGLDRATRISSVLLAWNAVQHFAPLLDEVKADWEQALEVAIQSAGSDKTEEEFLSTLRRMVATLQDGQARVEHKSDWRVNNIPVGWDWIEGKLVITRASKEKSSHIGVGPGDVVLQIGRRPAGDFYRDLLKDYAGMSEQLAGREVLAAMRRRAGNERVQMRVDLVSGRSINVDYLDTHIRGPMSEARPEHLSDVAAGVIYVNLSRLTEAEFAKVAERLAEAKAVVFDLRDGLKGMPYQSVIAHLTGKKVKDVEWRIPVSTRPNRKKSDWEKLRSEIEPAEPELKGDSIFLSNGTSPAMRRFCSGSSPRSSWAILSARPLRERSA